MEKRAKFIRNINELLQQTIKNKELEAFFFNWGEIDKKEKKFAEKTLNSILNSKWEFISIYGNGTNVGEGWFYNKKYEVYLSLSCYSENEDFIDTYEVYKKEEKPEIHVSKYRI